jgi:hypothetical protein
MWKNLALVAYTVLVGVFAVLWLAGKIDWTKSNLKESQIPLEQRMEKAAEILKPLILEMKDVQLLCIPSYLGEGTNYKFNYNFYVYENGNLKDVNYANK